MVEGGPWEHSPRLARRIREGGRLMLNIRMLRAIVAVAAIGWGAKKLLERRRYARTHPVYPSEAVPSSPFPGWATSSK